MDGNSGMFAGSDGALRYACLDATFYRLEMFRRPVGLTFTAAAGSLGRDVRVVANGQLFGDPTIGMLDYCWLLPCHVLWQGEIVLGHTALGGTPPTAPDFRHFA